MAHSDSDKKILEKLIEASGGVKTFSKTMKVSRQTVWEWGAHMTDTARIRIYLHAEAIGFDLPKDFLKRALAD